MNGQDFKLWDEYEWAAYCAARDSVVPDISSACQEEIDADRESFEERVRAYAYARAMESHTGEEE